MPEVFDITTDKHRTATQPDIDMLGAVGQAYADLRAAVETIHAELQARIKEIRSRAGLPA